VQRVSAADCSEPRSLPDELTSVVESQTVRTCCECSAAPLCHYTTSRHRISTKGHIAGGAPPPKCPFPVGPLGLACHGSLGPPESTLQHTHTHARLTALCPGLANHLTDSFLSLHAERARKETGARRNCATVRTSNRHDVRSARAVRTAIFSLFSSTMSTFFHK